MDYTKGTWKVVELPATYGFYEKDYGITTDTLWRKQEIISATGDDAYIEEDSEHFNKEALANAYLIAAAPAMAEVLRKVRANIGHIIMTKADAILVDEIDKALAQAEGR